MAGKKNKGGKNNKNQHQKQPAPETQMMPHEAHEGEEGLSGLDLLGGGGADLLQSLAGGLDTKKLFDTLFQQLLGGTKSKEFTKEELIENQADIDSIVEKVEANIFKVENICNAIASQEFEKIDKDDLPEESTTDDMLKDIEITPKIEKAMSKKTNEYATLMKREEMLKLKISETKKLINSFPEDSVCSKLGDLVTIFDERKLKSNTDFKKYIILKQRTELQQK